MKTKPFTSFLKKTLPFFLLTLILFTGNKCYSQLSGTYTLGDTTSDFSTFSDALNAIASEGLSGNVTFEVKPGVYYSVFINNLQNDSAYSVKFVYDGTPNDSAVITGQLHIHNSPYVTFKGFNIYPLENQTYSAVFIDVTPYFKLDSCKIVNIYNNQFSYDEGLINVDYNWDGQYIVDSIINCTIISQQKTIYTNGKKGVLIIKNSNITGPIKDAFGYIHKRYYNNTFYCTEDDYVNASQGFYNNTFYSAGASGVNIQATLKDNVFNHLWVNISSGTVTNNIFHGSAQINYCNNAKVTGNIFYGSFKSIYSHGIKILNNLFYENVSCNNDNTWFGNNLVYDTVYFSHGPGQMIINNNFERDAFFETYYTGGVLANNNLANVHILNSQIPAWKVENNNFVNLGNGNVNYYGINSHFYNPMYNNDLRSSNPLLTGKGKKPYTTVKYDIDSVLRKNPCTIGANEICFDWMPPTVDISCGDSLRLDICRDSLQNEYWSPSYLFDDTLSTNPVIYPQDTVTVYFINGTTGDTNSFQINVTIKWAPVTDVGFTVDIYEVSFYNHSRCADSYFWDFGDGETSDEAEPVHNYSQTGNYTCIFTASNSVGETSDTLNIVITAIDKNRENKNMVNVYPNPATDRLYVNSKQIITKLTITDLTGKTVAKISPKKSYTAVLNTENLPRGIYFLKVISGKTYRTVKFRK